MSRSLTIAARERYAPHGLFVLSRSAGSRTAVERFVEAVAGRWERSALELEEQLQARQPPLAWSEWSPARRRNRRRNGKDSREEAARAHDVDVGEPEEEASRIEPPPVASARATQRTSARAPELRPRDAGGRHGERRVEASSGRRRGPVRQSDVPSRGRIAERRETDVEPPMGRSRYAALRSHPASGIAQRGSAPPPFLRASQRTVDGARDDDEAPPVPGRHTPGSSTGRTDADRGVIRPAPFRGARAASGESTVDDDELRRRFDLWSLERRWRDEALGEWKGREF